MIVLCVLLYMFIFEVKMSIGLDRFPDAHGLDRIVLVKTNDGSVSSPQATPGHGQRELVRQSYQLDDKVKLAGRILTHNP